jgi:hypothetical protein
MLDNVKGLLEELTDEDRILAYDPESQDFSCVFCFTVIRRYVKRTYPYQYTEEKHAKWCPVRRAKNLLEAWPKAAERGQDGERRSLNVINEWDNTNGICPVCKWQTTVCEVCHRDGPRCRCGRLLVLEDGCWVCEIHEVIDLVSGDPLDG